MMIKPENVIFPNDLIALCIAVPMQMISSIVSLLYIFKKMQVSDNVKRILIAEAIIMLISSIAASIGLALLLFHEQNEVSCALVLDIIGLEFLIRHLLMTILAILRYYMAERTGNNKIIDDEKIKRYSYLAIFIICIGYCIQMLFSCIYGMHGTTTTGDCSASQNVSTLWVLMLTTVFCSSIFVCFYHDLKLLNFVNEYNAKNPPGMAIWSTKTNNIQNQLISRKKTLEKQLENNVPIISSWLTIIMFLFILLISSIGLLFNAEDDFKFEYNINASLGIMGSLHLPFVLGFTVKSKHRKKKHCAVNLPTGLQFYEEDEEDFSEIPSEDLANEVEFTAVEKFSQVSDNSDFDKDIDNQSLKKESEFMKTLNIIQESL